MDSAKSRFKPWKIYVVTLSFFSPRHTSFLANRLLACFPALFQQEFVLTHYSLFQVRGSALGAVGSSRAGTPLLPFPPTSFSNRNTMPYKHHIFQGFR